MEQKKILTSSTWHPNLQHWHKYTRQEQQITTATERGHPHTATTGDYYSNGRGEDGIKIMFSAALGWLQNHCEMLGY